MSEAFFRKICTSHFIVRVQGFMVRGSWRKNRLQYIDPHSYGRQHCVFLVLQGCTTGGPGAQLSAECWLSLPHLVTNWSPKLLGAPRAPSAGCGFPYHILWATSLDPNSSGGPEGPFGLVWLSLTHLVSNSNSNCLTSVLTELYNSSTPT